MVNAVMIPTRTTTINNINTMSDNDYKKVAVYVQSVISNNDRIAKDSEIEALSKKFNAKYESAFRALAQ